MTLIILGKILETLGAALLAYVGGRAALIDLFIVRPIIHESIGGDQQDTASATDRLVERLSGVANARRRQFGTTEVSIVALGSLLVAAGCAVYLIGLLIEDH